VQRKRVTGDAPKINGGIWGERVRESGKPLAISHPAQGKNKNRRTEENPGPICEDKDRRRGAAQKGKGLKKFQKWKSVHHGVGKAK